MVTGQILDDFTKASEGLAHTFGVRRVEAVPGRANVKTVQRMLRHASAATTLDVYADLFEDDPDQVADRLDQAATCADADYSRSGYVSPAFDAVRPRRKSR